MAERGWGGLVTALRQILDGARAADALLEPLDYEDAVIVQAVLDTLPEGRDKHA